MSRLKELVEANICGRRLESCSIRNDLLDGLGVTPFPFEFVPNMISGAEFRADMGCGGLTWGSMTAMSRIEAANETEPCARAMARDQTWLAVRNMRDWIWEARRRAWASRAYRESGLGFVGEVSGKA